METSNITNAKQLLNSEESAIVLFTLINSLEDIRAFDEAQKNIQAGEELIPSNVVYALLDGDNPIRVWREYRGLTQQHLATQAGISKPYLSQLESGKRNGTTEVLKNIAQILEVGLEDIVESSN